MKRSFDLGKPTVSPMSSVSLRSTLAPLPFGSTRLGPTRPKLVLRWQNIANTILVIAIFTTLLFEVRLLTRAQEGAAPENPAAGAPAEEAAAGGGVERLDEVNRCVTGMKTFMAEQQVEFGQFINEHFRSAKPTSELIPAAIGRFRQYREDIRIEMKNMIPFKQSVSAASTEREPCEAAVEEDFNIMRMMLAAHIRQNAVAKKSTRLLDEYKSLNKKLERLSFTIGQTYGYFAALSQKLPCYAKSCVP